MFPDHTLYEASTGGHFLNTLLKRWSTWSSLSEKPFSDNNNNNNNNNDNKNNSNT